MKVQRILFALLFMTGIHLSMRAEEVVVAGIEYRLDAETKSAEVGQFHSFMGNSLFVPSSIESQGVTYQVTSIGESAFKNFSWLTTVTISEGVEVIGKSAFEACTSLTTLSLASSLRTISERAFYGCSILEDLTIPDNTMELGLYSFDATKWYENQQEGLIYAGRVAYNYKGEMPANTNITIMDGTVGIADNAFSGCNNLSSVVFPNTLKHIGYNSFGECNGLKSLIFPDGLLSIGENAFFCCYGLESLAFPNSITSIGRMAFSDCNHVKTISLSESLTEIQQEVFKGCTSLESISIPSDVKLIGPGAFQDCSNLVSVSLPTNLEYLESASFANCTSLETINFPDGLKHIGVQAFMWDGALEQLDVPASVTSIGYMAFEGTGWLNQQADGVLYVGRVAYGYKGEMPSETSIELDEGTVGVAEDAFWSCNGITSVILPQSVVYIGMRAFQKCKNLLTVYCYAPTVPLSNAPYYSAGHFYGSTSNATLYVPAGCKAVYETADNWKNFKTIVEMGETTAVNRLYKFDGKDNNDYYNLVGQKVTTPYKGVVIRNGHKVIMK